jgi:hypothetical protein
MTIARTISIGIFVTFALAFATAALDPVYAVTPCCNYVGGKYINLKTGKEVTPPSTMKAAAPKTGGTTGASNPALAAPKTGGTTGGSNPAPSGSGGGGGHK